MTGSSYWPLLLSMSINNLLLTNLIYWHFYIFFPVCLAVMSLGGVIFVWTRDLGRESNFLGSHTLKVQMSMKLGMMFFIFSEVMFFFSIFWCFFHFALNPVGEVGLIWPPSGIQSLNYLSIPLLNTIILVSSGLTLTISHSFLLLNSMMAMFWLGITVMLGVAFTGMQMFEYYEISFSMMHGNFGSIFFMATGFHGLHVLVGSILLLVCFVKLIKYNYTMMHHVSFEVSAWYWHFVDVVWLFLFIFVYWWAS